MSKPDAPAPPGQILKEQLLGKGRLTQLEVARVLGVSPPRLSMVFSGRCQVSAEIALRVERVFGIPSGSLMAARDAYELHRERERMSEELKALPALQD